MWQSKNIRDIRDIRDIKPFVPGVPYFVSEQKEEKMSKSAQNKRGGIIAYTDNGDLFVVFQNVMTWSFPKGHFEIEKDRSILDTAIREFHEETKYPGYIDPSRLTKKMVIDKKHIFYLFKMTPEEVEMLPIISQPNDEVLESRWVNLSEFDNFRRKNHVNKTISEFNIPRFLTLADLSSSSSSFGKRKRSVSKKRKSKRVKRKSTTKKSKRVTRKSTAKNRKSKRITRK